MAKQQRELYTQRQRDLNKRIASLEVEIDTKYWELWSIFDDEALKVEVETLNVEIEALEEEKENLISELEGYGYLILWDYDGPFNSHKPSSKPYSYKPEKPSDSEVDELEKEKIYTSDFSVNIPEPSINGLTLRVIEEMNGHSVQASQRITFKGAVLEKFYVDPMKKSLDDCFGKDRAFLTQEEAEIISKGVDPSKVGSTKVPFLENSKKIERSKWVQHENRILVDDNIVYREEVIKKGYRFIYAPGGINGCDLFFKYQHLAQIILFIAGGNLSDALDFISQDPLSDQEAKGKLKQLVLDEYVFEGIVQSEKGKLIEISSLLSDKVSRGEAGVNLKKQVTALYDLIASGQKVHADEVAEILTEAQRIINRLMKENNPQKQEIEEIQNKLNEVVKSFSQVSTEFNQNQKTSIKDHAKGLYKALKDHKCYLTEKKHEKYDSEIAKIKGFMEELEIAKQGRNEVDLETQSNHFKAVISKMKETGYINRLQQDPHASAKKILSFVVKLLACLTVIGAGIVLANALHKKEHNGVGLGYDSQKHKEEQNKAAVVEKFSSSETLVGKLPKGNFTFFNKQDTFREEELNRIVANSQLVN